MRRGLVLGLLVAAPMASGSRADQGRIPIFAPTTITQPGSYVLTRDITVSTGSAIAVNANDVTLDLNGHTITGGSTVGTLILIGYPANGIRIINGRLVGALEAVQSVKTVPDTQGTDLVINGVEFSGQTAYGVSVGNANYFEMTSCTLKNVSVGVSLNNGDGTGGPVVSARIVGNQFIQIMNDGVDINGGRDVLIKDNVFTEVQRTSVSAVGSGILVTKNVFNGPGVPDGLGVVLYGGGNHVLENSFENYVKAIEVVTSGNRIAGNLIVVPSTATYSPFGIIVVDGGLGANRNLIELNTITLPAGCGIHFNNGTQANAYRSNVLRLGGGSAVCDFGTGNTDEGGNVY